jgi:hypothetical protein
MLLWSKGLARLPWTTTAAGSGSWQPQPAPKPPVDPAMCRCSMADDGVVVYLDRGRKAGQRRETVGP